MASEKKSNGKDLGTPIGIVAGLIIILIGIALQETSELLSKNLIGLSVHQLYLL